MADSQSFDHPAGGHDFREGTKGRTGEQLADVGELEPEAQVRFVAAKAVEGVAVAEPWERRSYLRVYHLGHHVRQEAFVEIEDVVLVHEGHLDVELGKVWLAVGAEILVAKAAGDLEVAVDPTDHQQLLEQLRRLRQGVEATAAARNQIVSGALRRRQGQQRRLDLDKAFGIEKVPDGLGEPVADQQRLEGEPGA